MKKDLIFSPVLLVIGVLLFLLKATGMTAHIVISVVGVLVLAAYAISTKDEWKLPILEIAMRIFYGIALVSGIVIKTVGRNANASIAHKVSAALFVVLLVVLLVHKLVTAKKTPSEK